MKKAIIIGKLAMLLSFLMLGACNNTIYTSIKCENLGQGRVRLSSDNTIPYKADVLWDFNDNTIRKGFQVNHEYKFNGYYRVEFNGTVKRKKYYGSEYVFINDAKVRHSIGEYQEGHVWADFDLEVRNNIVYVTNTSLNTGSYPRFELDREYTTITTSLNTIGVIPIEFSYYGIYRITLTLTNTTTGELDKVEKFVDMRHLPHEPPSYEYDSSSASPDSSD